MNKAVFLDRDGVINPLVYNVNTGEYESPHVPEDFSLYPYVLKALKLIKKLGFKIIIISNQPSYAKGKTTMENIKAIENMLYIFSEENGKLIDEYYYCYHHPDGVIAEYTQNCLCRKPGTLFVEKAIQDFNLNIKECYFVGDQDTDIQCGNSMGMYTIKIDNKHSLLKSGNSIPGETVKNLCEAVQKINDRNEFRNNEKRKYFL
jgi:D-glycero-D-manno-heptose 1,7-bisphosphate phosphatase